MTDVQVTVGLRREAGMYEAVFAAGQIFINDIADKMIVGELFFIHHGTDSNVFQTGMFLFYR